MTNNDVLRRLRYTFSLNDTKMIKLFLSAGSAVTRGQISNWLKKDDHADYVNCSDVLLATFLNGFINEKRGKKEGEQPVPEKKLSTNIILMKLKIALNLKAEDIIAIMDLASFPISTPELSALFRKSGHKHYRECKDQFMRNFLHGVQIQYRKDDDITEDAKNDNHVSHSKKTDGDEDDRAKTVDTRGFSWKQED
jgi:uncharacterized protein YehS (DUF1456 family)